MTGEDHNSDAMIAALRSPALTTEQVGEAAAVSAMLETISASSPAGSTWSRAPGSTWSKTPGSTWSRSRKGIAIAAVTVASLGVGGLAAAGPGIFVPDFIQDLGGSDDSVADTGSSEFGPDAIDAPTTVPDNAPGDDEGLPAVGTIVGQDDEGTVGAADGDVPQDDERDGDGTTTPDADCAETDDGGNHGRTVSDVARGADPAGGKGDEVSEAAHDCDESDDDAAQPEDDGDAPGKSGDAPGKSGDNPGNSGDNPGNGGTSPQPAEPTTPPRPTQPTTPPQPTQPTTPPAAGGNPGGGNPGNGGGKPSG